MAADIPDGAVIVARAIVNSSLWTMPDRDLRLALLCIVRAQHRDTRFYDGRTAVIVRRGQFLTSRRKLATEARMSEQNVRSALNHLESTHFLTQKSTQHGTLITLPKYDFYQDLRKYSDATNPEINPKSTRCQPTVNPRPATHQGGCNPPGRGNNKAKKRGTPPLRVVGTYKGIRGGEGVFCSEASKTMPSEPPQGLKDLILYCVDEKLCRRWSELLPAWTLAYPAVDVMAEIRMAHAWEVANPTRRKKDRARFLASWLSRAQDRNRSQGHATPTGMRAYAPPPGVKSTVRRDDAREPSGV